MSSKSVSPAAPAGTGSPSPRPWSLTIWLALCNAGAAFLILFLISLLLYLGLKAQLKSQNHLYLHDQITTLERMLRARGGESNILNEISENSQQEYIKHCTRLLDKNGRVLVETPGMDRVAVHEDFSIPRRDGRPGVDKTWSTSSGKLMLGTSEWLDLGNLSEGQGIIEVALDITNVQKILEGYRVKIYCGLALGLVLCLAVSLAIARRGTRPLREITEMVEIVTASRLKERILVQDWPDEVGRLAFAMNAMMDRLQDSFERLYNSARNLSHKVRTPLTILRGEAEVALSRTRSVEELESVIVSSLEENNRLQRLVDNILFLADAELGKFHTRPGPIDAGMELDTVLDFYGPVAEEKGITLTRQGEAKLFVDAALFRKAVASLISNAVTYNREGGSATVTLRQGEGLAGELLVCDDGLGIPVAERDKIFDRFYRIYRTRHMDPHGTGLGLPITKAIMDLHCGSVSLHSDENVGTTVTLTFAAPT